MSFLIDACLKGLQGWKLLICRLYKSLKAYLIAIRYDILLNISFWKERRIEVFQIEIDPFRIC